MSSRAARPCIRFAEFALDFGNERLIAPNGPVRIGNKAFGVLSALAENHGRLVTKEELFETVWSGTIVSESALTSVIKELRRALGDEPKCPRFIESVYGRGYRFLAPTSETEMLEQGPCAPNSANGSRPSTVSIASGTAVAPSEVGRNWSRRKALAAAAGVAAFGVAGAAWTIRLAKPATVPPEIDQLVFRACQAMEQNTRAGQYQAIGLLRRVVALAPDFADGWGRLGVVYAVPSHYRERAEGLMLRARAEAAARRALALDPNNVYGELALGIALPFVGPYLQRDRHFQRAMDTQPGNDDVLTFMAINLQFVGRAAEAVPLYKRIKQYPLTPAVYREYIMALWSAGLLEELDRALADATDLYPTDGAIWRTRFAISALSGHAAAAIAQVQDSTGLPDGADPGTLRELMAMARAIESPDSPEAAALADSQLKEARESASGAASVITVLAALGRVDEAFSVANGYYFNRGFAVSDYRTPGSRSSLEQRQTRILFEPETRPMRADPRFERLVRELGLDDYWRRSRTTPDYRRSGTKERIIRVMSAVGPDRGSSRIARVRPLFLR